ncbi:MAG: ABC transporter substrate-binding protein [Chloroflexi bacterium]|nr:ABC transporter substrate-binding protein [Chloroflexota bacterium]MYG90776.1 ABC transporter substrate-binding protein [Chloroflexota bacterium]MYJ92787.1 ABC transporter substrate-binding protein [Chloroflexota bacterium]
MPSVVDATDTEIDLERPAREVVSLVPSFTELVCSMRLASRLVGVTRFCVEPADVVAPIRKVGGTKNPDIERIIRLEPQLVLANREENNEDDVAALRKAGLNVYVGDVRTAEEAHEEIDRVGRLLGGISLKIGESIKESLEEQEHVQRLRPRVRAAALIWRNPYMAASGDTYIGDLLRVSGAINVCEDSGRGRYPRLSLTQLVELDPEVILLPSEPYRFRERHAEELLAQQGMSAGRNGHVYLCDGQNLTWWGVRTGAAIQEVSGLLDHARSGWQAEAAMAPELPPGLNLNVIQQDVVE